MSVRDDIANAMAGHWDRVVTHLETADGEDTVQVVCECGWRSEPDAARSGRAIAERWEHVADAVLAALPRRWGVRVGENDFEPCVDEEDARFVAEETSHGGTVVSWIEVDPEEVPDAGA